MKTTTAQHTPGPWSEWQTRDGESDTFHATEILGSNQIIVCRFDPWRGSAIQEAQANAELIASAPDLLASLGELSEWMRSHTGAADGTHEMLCRAVIAIAKAKGDTATVWNITAAEHRADRNNEEKGIACEQAMEDHIAKTKAVTA
jgi:hypothetical protein